MGKVKVSSKNGMVTVKVRSDNGENIDMNTVQWLAANSTAGYIAPAVEFNGSKFTTTYTAMGCTTLKHYIKDGINTERFLMIIESLVDILSTMSVHNLNYSNVMLEMNTVMVNQSTGRTVLIYYPVTGYNNSKYFNMFLGEIYNSIKINKKADNTYLTEFEQIINDVSNLSWDVMKQYVNKWKSSLTVHHSENLASNDKKGNTDKCLKCGYENSASAKFCVKCGAPLNSGIMQSIKFNSEVQQSPNPVNTGIPAYYEEGTTVLSEIEEDDATTVLSQPIIQRVYPDMLRVSTQEDIKIDRDVFNIGKSKNSDYMVVGNSAVSRNHANIIYEAGEYYIVDNDSTNHTYVNGNMIMPSEKYMLNDGDNIVIANEAFVFNYKRN